MIPKVDFQVHEVMVKAFLFAPVYKGKRNKFDEDVEKFRALFNSRGNEILTLVEKFSGFPWTQGKIAVFLIPRNPVVLYSFTKFDLEDGLPGIVQKVDDNNKRNLHIFIHELCHVNHRQGGFYSEKYGVMDRNGVRNENLTELGADLMALYITQALFAENSEYEKDFWDFLQNTNEKNKRKFGFLEKYKDVWDLNKNTLKHYLENENQEFNPKSDK